MGSRMGLFPPPPSSGLYSEAQVNHWAFMLHVNRREDLGGAHPSQLLAGSLGAIGMGIICPSLSRTIIMSTGLAQWFHMDPDANFTIAGSRRSQVAWVILIYLIGFHVIHHAHESVQRSLHNHTIAQARDNESAFVRTGRYDAINFFYTIAGKHSQDQRSTVVN